MNKFRYLIPVAVLLAGAGKATAQELSETGQFVDGVAAVVNEGVVLKSELAREEELILLRATQQGMQLPPAHVIREQVLERLVVEEIQLQRAFRIGIQVSDQMLNQTIAAIAENAGSSFEDMPEILARQGIDYGEYRRDTRKQMMLEQLRRIEVVNRISVSPREIEQCIADLDDKAVVNSRYDLSQLFLSVPSSATSEQFAGAAEVARTVYYELSNGADFRQLAIRHSDGDTALEGGGLGWRPGDQLPTLFFDIVGNLQEGEFSEPIRAVSGYHIVKINQLEGVTEKSEIEQMRVRHILVTPDQIIDEETAQQQLEDARERILDGEDFGEVAKLLSDDPGSASQGGEMGWTSPGEFVPEFEEVANNVELGEMSEPFRSRFGWHIMEIQDRKVEDMGDEARRNMVLQLLHKRRFNEELEEWLKEIRDEAFVEVRLGKS